MKLYINQMLKLYIKRKGAIFLKNVKNVEYRQKKVYNILIKRNKQQKI